MSEKKLLRFLELLIKAIIFAPTNKDGSVAQLDRATPF